MLMKTSELIGHQLDAAVALAHGYKLRLHTYRGVDPGPPVWVIDFGYDWNELWNCEYSVDWALGGPIIEHEFIELTIMPCGHSSITFDTWLATIGHADEDESEQSGPTPLIAAMRCFVASKLGDEVDVPEGLK